MIVFLIPLRNLSTHTVIILIHVSCNILYVHTIFRLTFILESKTIILRKSLNDEDLFLFSGDLNDFEVFEQLSAMIDNIFFLSKNHFHIVQNESLFQNRTKCR